MRILSVGLLYPPHYVGGYELIGQGVMQAARARGHDVQVLVSDYRAPGIVEPDEPAVDRGLRSYLDATVRESAPIGFRECLRIEHHNAAAMERHLREFKPDVVSWWGMGGLSLALIEQVRRARVASVLDIQDQWPIYGLQTDIWARRARRLRSLAPILEPLLGLPVRLDIQDGGRFLFNSQPLLDEALAAGFDPHDRTVLTPGVHCRYSAAPQAPDWSGRLLYVGRLEQVKGVDVLVDALAHLPHATLRLVGSGSESYQTLLRNQARTLGVEDRVEWAGPIDAELLPSVYAQADAVIFPVRWREPWGLVPLEAMAVGRPVIATSRGGAATYLRDEQNALIMPVDDPQALSGLVRRLAKDPALRTELREGGFRTAAEHSAERYEQLVVDEFERAARGEDRGR